MKSLFWRQPCASAVLALLLSLGFVSTPASASEDFWQWLKPQLRLSQIQHPSIEHWEARYRRRHLELEVILEDGKDFLYPLALAVADRDIPLELALLPIIESHLDPTAVSSSGARGLWQFLPKTAQHLGLKQDWWHNESADFHRSTQAALNYLDYLHDRFGGWLLSLAAYNAGEGRIWSLMKSNRQRGKTMDYWDLQLPQQTQVYVPKLLGLARVLSDPQRVRLPKIDTRRKLIRLQTPMALDVAQIAKMAKISIEQVYRFNPQWLRWGMPPSAPHSVYLPVESSTRFRQALAQLDKSDSRRWHHHKVKAGESLSLIAQEHATKAQLISQLNDLAGKTIQPHQQLILPQGKSQIDAATRRAVRKRTRLEFAPRPLAAGVHRVESGESLWSIARRYGSSVAALQRANQLNSRTALVPGQLLHTAAIDQRQRISYTVKTGDALSLIAQRYKVSVSQIQKWNQLDSATIRPGQKLELRLSARSG